MSMSLTSFPVELIDQIVDGVDNPERLGTLNNFALCSHTFNSFVTPHLYSHISLPYTKGQESYDDLQTNFKHLRPFTKLMLENPYLASLVHSFTLRPYFYTPEYDMYGEEDEEKSRRETSENEDSPRVVVEDVFRSAIKASAHSEREEAAWLRALEDGYNDDAVLALLLPALPNLRRLDLMLSFPSKYYWRMLERAAKNEKPFDTNPAFPALTDIMNTDWDTKHGMSCDALARYLALPAVKSIYAHLVGDSGGSELATLPSASSRVTHLELREADVPGPYVKDMLRAIATLKTFIYEKGWGHFSYEPWTIPDIETALVPHRSSLENLWLDWADDDGSGRTYWAAMAEDLSPISLNHFKILKHVRIAMTFIFDLTPEMNSVNEGTNETEKDFQKEETTALIQRLPPTIEKLHIAHTNQHVRLLLSSLRLLLSQREQHTPRLRELSFDAAFHGDRYHFGHDVDEVEGLAEEKGVILEMFDTTEVVGKLGLGMDGDIPMELERGYGTLAFQKIEPKRKDNRD
ncbi:MAG: hypothetical protein M1834_001757 [Cirrosporium novae-zelandiae]|nr:MAG: hypothetical protein M1834_001757 [Cirrosporium novae-zelandiae]